MKSREMEGRSVEDAVRRALADTGWPEGEVKVEVLDEGSGGLLGWLGSRPARVRVSRRPTKLETAATFLRDIVKVMGLGPVALETREAAEHLFLEAKGPGLGLLIGRRGTTLDGLERVVNAGSARDSADRRRVTVDVEGYRRKRQIALERLAVRLAERARRTGASVALEPMSAPERRLIHLTLRGNPYVTTHSEGEEPRRRVIIALRGAGQRKREGGR